MMWFIGQVYKDLFIYFVIIFNVYIYKNLTNDIKHPNIT